MEDRFQKQLAFLVEIDRLKNVYRQNVLMDSSRHENDAEHSWHLAMAGIVLSEYAPHIDLLRAIKMTLVHDLVEIDAGDTFAYDEAGHKSKEKRERLAAERIFAILPEKTGCQLCALWEEFDQGKSAEAEFANALDRMIPFLHNMHSQGYTWRQHDVRRTQVQERMEPVLRVFPQMRVYIEEKMDEAVKNGWLKE